MKTLDTSLPIRRLYWKEARTLLPLLILLGALASILHLGGLLDSHEERPSAISNIGVYYFIFIGYPILFAVGAGAITIGQEKELRTIEWLSSLPIRPRDLIQVKLVSCVLGLLASLILSGAMLIFVGLLDSSALELPLQWQGESQMFLFTWPIHSFYLLLSSVAIAWYSRSSLTGLILLIPIAVIPGFAADSFEYVYSRLLYLGPVSNFAKLLVLSTIQIGLCWTAYWLSWKFATQALSAQEIKSDKLNLFKTFVFNSSTAEQKAWQVQPVLHPSSALVWQSFRQNRRFFFWTATVIVATFAYGVRGEVVNQLTFVGPNWFPFMLTTFLGACGLGVLTFQSDRMQRRIGFLSHRGVSVTLTWLTRQLVPAGVFCTVIIVCYGLFFWNHDTPELSKYSDPFVIISLAALMFSSYALAQWVGQVFANPIVAVLASPLIAFAIFQYLLFAWRQMSAPIWLLALSLAFPLLATWAAMSRWMDLRMDKVFWSIHGGFFLAFLVLLTIPMTATILMLPRGMSPEIANELAAEAEKHNDYDLLGYRAQLSLVIPRPPDVGVKLDPSETLASLRQQVLSSLQQRVRANTGPLLIDTQTMDYIRSEAILCIDRLLKNSKGEVAETIEKTDSKTNEIPYYRALLKLASDTVVRARLSHSILQQDLCDMVEIWLLQEMQRAKANPMAMKLLSDDLYTTITGRLSNSKDRNDARKRAIALSWKESQMPERNPRWQPVQLQGNSFGQYRLEKSYNYDDPSWVNLAIRKQKVAALASELWKLAKAGARSNGPVDADRNFGEIAEAHWTQIASIADVPIQFYGIGPRGEFLRADDINRFMLEINGSQRLAPASQWFADWERQAEALVTKELP